ncbi:MAG: hypothetical protein V2I32_02775 [Desulforhopalus sp.]|nr:hypothetical protein [Desulforhopalus sp.]
MPRESIYPSGDKITKAIKEFSLLLEEKPDRTRRQLLCEVALQFDLSPRECLFLEEHFSQEGE